MRKLLLLGAAALVLPAVPAFAQFVDPRTAAGAAGEITGQVSPGIETPAEVDPTRDPALQQRPAAAPGPEAIDPSDLRARTPAPPPAAGAPPRTEAETPTTAPLERHERPQKATKPSSRRERRGR